LHFFKGGGGGVPIFGSGIGGPRASNGGGSHGCLGPGGNPRTTFNERKQKRSSMRL